MNIGWRTPNGLRIETLDDDVIKLIKRSNCKGINLGLEHGDSEMLSIMDKKLDLGKAFEVIKSLVQYKIPRIDIFILVGYPGDTDKRFNNSLAYLKKIKELGGNIGVAVNIVQAYPGTRLLKRCLEKGYIVDRNIGNLLIRKEVISTESSVQITTPDFDARKVFARKEAIINCIDRTMKYQYYLKKYLPNELVEWIRYVKGKFC